MNCKSCIKQPGRCGFFPALADWTGDGFRCCEPRYWERCDQSVISEKAVPKPAERTNFFACSVTIEEKAEKKPAPICSNIICSKRNWCGEEIAKKCQLFVLLQEQTIISNNSQEVVHETQM